MAEIVTSFKMIMKRNIECLNSEILFKSMSRQFLNCAVPRMEAINILVQSLYFMPEESEGNEKINDSLRFIFN